jgi:hypothetical protein
MSDSGISRETEEGKRTAESPSRRPADVLVESSSLGDSGKH